MAVSGQPSRCGASKGGLRGCGVRCLDSNVYRVSRGVHLDQSLWTHGQDPTGRRTVSWDFELEFDFGSLTHEAGRGFPK